MTGSARTIIATAYNEAAMGFARSADRLVYHQLARPLVSAVVAVAGEDPGLVLDVAAGSGAFGRHFRRAVALDVAMGQLTRNNAGMLLQADAEALPFRADAFAAVGCAFGINHLLDPRPAIREMARVAPVVAVSTWLRPEPEYAPKRIVHDVLARRTGRGRTPTGELLDRLNDQVGSVDAVAELLRTARLEAQVQVVGVEIDWPGADAYLDYRLAMPSTSRASEVAAVRADVERALADVSADELVWHPALVVGVGSRQPLS